jgi:ABC-type nitrate/sulfonate/bicarbonate transport system substrate-binding protein
MTVPMNREGWATDPLIILTAASQGNQVKLAGIVTSDLAYTIMVSKEGKWLAEGASFVEKMAALKGKKIGVSGIGAGTDHALILLLNAAGLSVADVTRVGIGQQQAAIGQLAGGAIDAFVSFSLSGNAIIEQQTGARAYLFTDDPIVPASVRAVPFLCLAVSGEFAAKNPDVVANWLAAEEEAINWIKGNPSEAAVILNKYVFNGQQAELAKSIIPKMITFYFDNTPAGFKVSHKAFATLLDAAHQLESVPSSQQLKYEDLVIPVSRTSD